MSGVRVPDAAPPGSAPAAPHAALGAAPAGTRPGTSFSATVERVRLDRRIGLAVALVIGALSGAVSGLLMPFGPTTTAQLVAAMLGGAGTGFAVGFLVRTRWALLLAPAAHVAALELVRRGTDVPSVDRVDLGSSWGLVVLVLGRGVYALLVIVPMLLGITYGAALARRVTGLAPRGHAWAVWGRRVACGLVAVCLVAVLGLALRPASVPPICDAEGRVVPSSIAALEKVRLGGHDQWIEIRGQRATNPVLLYLSGGPGQSDLAFSRVILSDLTRRFTLVGWDQRGNGKSYPSLDPASLTLDRAVGDAVELAAYLKQRFGGRPVYVLGESWGTTLAVLAAQRRPDLFAAVVSSGQMVSQRETDRRIYRDALAYAARTGDSAMAATLRGFGEPPYRDVYAYGYVMGLYDRLAGTYDPPAAYEQRGREAGLGPSGLLGSEYALIDKVNVLRGLVDTFGTLYPQLQAIDFRRDVPRLEVPLYVLDGEHELAGRRSLALEWFAGLQAPRKRLYTFTDAGHAVAFERFQDLDRVLTTVLADTAGG